ncbi:MAG: hypothetical protein ACI9R8_001809, partial [Candidatus Paceibacteria bacterium]
SINCEDWVDGCPNLFHPDLSLWMFGSLLLGL